MPQCLRAGALSMGRGNWQPMGYGVADYGGYYVDVDYDDEHPWETDYFIDDLKSTVVEEMMDHFPSFCRVKKWEHDGVVILENYLAQVVIGDNENSMAVYVVIPDTEYFRYPELGKKQLKGYLAGLQVILLKYYAGQVRIRTGPWTSGVLRAAI